MGITLMKVFFSVFLVVSFFTFPTVTLGDDGTNSVPAINYEDAEDLTTTGWFVYDTTPEGATINNIYDSDRNGRVIAFSGAETYNGYRLRDPDNTWWNNNNHKIIEWSMNYSERVIVYIATQTTHGFRYIYYSSDNRNYLGDGRFIHHGLGSVNIDGDWHTFTRNLEDDLHDAQPDNDLEFILGFLIRGSGRVDDIKTMASIPSNSNMGTPYQYDTSNRLYRIHQNSLHFQYNYDDAGNRISLSTNSNDYDFDGILDTIENGRCTSSTDSDTDNDGIPDNIEDSNYNGLVDNGETNPCEPDTDNDGLWDGLELGYWVSVSPDTDASVFQSDTDSSTTTNPLLPDTDSDGIADGVEDKNGNGQYDSGETNSLNADTDNDNIMDGDEDTNHNGHYDAGETNPLNSDTDGDGFSDGFEVHFGMNAIVPDTSDYDGDGLVDGLENATCTSAGHVDSDGDTLRDGTEDANHNGIRDAGETNPCKQDSDGDGLRDDVDPEPTIHINGRIIMPQSLLLLLKD